VRFQSRLGEAAALDARLVITRIWMRDSPRRETRGSFEELHRKAELRQSSFDQCTAAIVPAPKNPAYSIGRSGCLDEGELAGQLAT